MLFRTRRQFRFKDGDGNDAIAVQGKLVEVRNRHDAERLLREGFIEQRELSSSKPRQGKASRERTPTKRIGIWLITCPYYSGGRVFMYQYANALAQQGAEVWLFTGAMPMWARDFPPSVNLHIDAGSKHRVPTDLDLIVTDCRGTLGEEALDYKQRNPHIPFVLFSFETSNWFSALGFDKYGKMLNDERWRPMFKAADHIVSISKEGQRYLQKWLGPESVEKSCLLYPAVNDYAEASLPDRVGHPSKRPFAVYSARPVRHKGSAVALSAVWDLPRPFDVVVFGRAMARPADTELHRLIHIPTADDREKYHYMRNAHMVLAPSEFEGFGMVPGEAMLAGTQAVVYDLPVLREVYGDRLIYVPLRDEEKYRETVKRVALAPKPDFERERIWVRDTYGWQSSMAKRIEALPHHAMKTHAVSVAMIAYGTPGITGTLESLYPTAKEINIAHGPVGLWKGSSDYGCLEEVRNFPDPQGKIRLEARPAWPTKKEMWQWCSSQTTGNYLLLTGADMIWVGLEEWLRAGHKFATPRWVNFWHDEKHWIYGEHNPNVDITGHAKRWGNRLDPFGSACNHHLFSWWRPSYGWEAHTQPRDAEGRSLFTPAENLRAAMETPATICYHLGHALPPEIMEEKHQFYISRDGTSPESVQALMARQSMWASWDGQTGPSGDGIVEEVSWPLPDVVQRTMQQIRSRPLLATA